MRHYGLVEVDSAQALHTFGNADELELVVAAPHECSVERAASEVVDRDDLARLDALLARVGDGGGLGFGDQDDVAAVESCETCCFAERADLVLGIVGRVRQNDNAGCLAFLLRGAAHDLAQ